jgi:TRAP-type C4-dicarboxylate transport system permease large subunit
VIGPIIPPSGIMIIYAYVMGESVAALFLAGIVPGVMVGVGLMLVVKFMADKYDFPVASRKSTWGERGQAASRPSSRLLTPVIILGGILAGVFTPRSGCRCCAPMPSSSGCCSQNHGRMGRPAGCAEPRLASHQPWCLLLVGAAMAFKTVVSCQLRAADHG